MEAMERQDYVSESDVLPLDKSPILGFYAGHYTVLEGNNSIESALCP